MIQIEQQPIDERIGQAMMEAMPTHWQGIALNVERNGEADAERYTIDLGPLQGEPGLAIVSDELQDAIRELYLLHRSHGTGMRVARYFVQPDGDEWKLVSEFEYDD